MLSDADIMTQVLAAFQEEQVEHRQAITDLLLALERAPDPSASTPAITQLFREAHSLKGGARAAGQEAVERIAHQMEDVFSTVRQGRLVLTPAMCDPLYAALEAIGQLMDQVAAGQPASLEPHAPLLTRLAALIDPAADPAADAAPPVPAPLPAAAEEPRPGASDTSTVRLATATLDNLLNETSELMAATVRARQRMRETEELVDIPARWRRTARAARPSAARLQRLTPAVRPTIHHLSGRAGFTRDEDGGRGLALRDEHDLATLLDAFRQADQLLGELERRLSLLTQRSAGDHAQLATVADRLHTQIRHTRMLPLATMVNPLRLHVREMARGSGKAAHLSIDDGDTQADRQVLDHLRDVLLHLLRNAVDHGIEEPLARRAAGKPDEGRIALHARVAGDQLQVVLEDDGAGVSLAAVRQRAQESGLASQSEVGGMEPAELLDLLFAPGFSTRRTVGALSGRGVGLDIARSTIQRIRGQIAIQSTPGHGTTITISVPLTLSSAQTLLVSANEQRYALPVEAVQRIVALEPQEVRVIEGRPAVVINGRPVVVVQLAQVLGLPFRRLGDNADRGYGLVLGTGERQVVCVVDAVLGEHALVVQRLPPPLRRVRFVANTAMLPDGAVVPVLDVVDLVRGGLGLRQSALPAPLPATTRHAPRILVVDDSLTTRTLEKNILEAAGYAVTLATDGAAALELLSADQPGYDLLLSDIDMPRLDGFELTSAVRADERLRRLPVVLVTSLDSPADRERGIAAGADAYIVKRAFDQRALIDTIQSLL
jgi:two-component system chemotaxis sensor kinase CheA